MLLACVRKELKLLLTDRGSLLRMFLLPLAFMGFFGFMFADREGEPAERAIATWHAPGDARTASIVRAIDDSELFRARGEDGAEAVRARVASGEVLAGVIVPPDFDPLGSRPAELVIDEAAPPAVRGPIQGALTGVVARAYFGAGEAAPELLVARTPPGIKAPARGADSFQIAVPGNAVLFSFFIAVTMGIAFIEERTTGTWRRLLAAPAPRPLLLLAKLIPYYIVGLLQMAFLFGTGILAFGMRIGGSAVGLLLITMASVFAAVALGLLIASFSGTARQVGGMSSLAVMLMALIGGCMVPRLLMPDSIRDLGLLVPHAWALDAYYDLIVRDGTTARDVAAPLLALLGFGALFAGIGAARFRFER